MPAVTITPRLAAVMVWFGLGGKHATMRMQAIQVHPTTVNSHAVATGTQDGVEQCDDANSVDNDACRNNCTLAACGDGIVQANRRM